MDAGSTAESAGRSPRRARPEADTGAEVLTEGAAEQPASRRLLQVALLAVPVAIFAVLAWTHHWVIDDGFINLRIVRQVEAGNGPVFNNGVRVETYTSALWLGLLLVGDALLPLKLEWVAVVLGVAGSVAGLTLAVAGSVRLHRRNTDDRRLLVPFGALVVMALYPMWFFASSGLEGGLVFAWLGGCTFLLATWAADPDRTVGWAGAAVLGLGWLIRPELALVSALFLAVATIGQWSDRNWFRRIGFLAAGLVLPVAYQIFRMGYFGSIVPNTALAKAAGSAQYRRGLRYLWDLVGPYTLWIPVGLLLVAGYGLLLSTTSWDGWRRIDRRALVAGAFAVGGAATTFYIVRVGGDYIHARLLLPSVFTLCAPMAVIAVDRRVTAGAAAVALVWAGVTAVVSPGEVKYRTSFGDRANLVTAQEVLGQPPGDIFAWYRGKPLYWEQSRLPYAPNPSLPRPTIGRLGIGVTGFVLGPDVDIYDELGLGDPITARFRIPSRRQSFPGHEKPSPPPWSAARLTAPGTMAKPGDFYVMIFDLIPPLVPPSDGAEFQRQVAVVRRVLQCRPMRDLNAAITDELTPGRFIRNIGYAISHRSFEIPPVPDDAQRELCGNG